MAKDYIISQADPDLVGIQEFFDYEVSSGEAEAIYWHVIEAKIEVSWD